MATQFTVIFGRQQSETAVLQRLEAWQQGQGGTGVQVFQAGTTPPFRLCSDELVRFPPAILADVPDTASKVARLKADISRDMDVFAKNPRRLLDLYFDFIAAQVETESAALDALLQPLGGLFRIEDWTYTALRPLPNAAVFAADDPEISPAVLLHDMVFWTGQTVLAIRLRGGATPPPRETDACDGLQAMGVHIVTIPAGELATGIEIFSDARFPPEFRFFWQGAPYPCSPFRPQGLPRSLAR